MRPIYWLFIAIASIHLVFAIMLFDLVVFLVTGAPPNTFNAIACILAYQLDKYLGNLIVRSGIKDAEDLL